MRRIPARGGGDEREAWIEATNSLFKYMNLSNNFLKKVKNKEDGG